MRDKKRIKPFLKYIEQEWLKEPDARFGQLLINLGIVKDDFQTWVSEISDYPLPHKVVREVQTWGHYEGHVMSQIGPIPTYKQIKIKDLETSHIKNILKTQKHIKDTPIEKVLKEELSHRKTIKAKKKSR